MNAPYNKESVTFAAVREAMQMIALHSPGLEPLELRATFDGKLAEVLAAHGYAGADAIGLAFRAGASTTTYFVKEGMLREGAAILTDKYGPGPLRDAWLDVLIEASSRAEASIERAGNLVFAEQNRRKASEN